MLDKSKFRVFCLSFQMCCKASEATWDVNHAFGLDLQMSVEWRQQGTEPIQWHKQAFYQGDKRPWKMISVAVSHQKPTTTKWEQSPKQILLHL